MENNRRDWLKKVGLGLAGLSVGQLNTFANTNTIYDDLTVDSNNSRILLRSNENPYGPSPLAKIAMQKNVGISNRYGWTLTSELTEVIAKKNHVTKRNVLLGAGSTEILDLVLRFTALKKGSFIMSETSYSYWTYPAKALGFKKITVPLTKSKKIDLTAMLKSIKADTKMIYICNPNNPTGTICERNELVSFIKEASKKVLVLVDEAYIEFTNQQSLSNLAIENKNLIVAKTFSKMYGLAGARIGYAIANESTINEISKLQSWPNGSISVVSAAGALASLKDENFKEEVCTKNEKVKKYTIENLELLNIKCVPSHSNFIYFSLSNYKKDFFKQLKINNIVGTKIYEEDGKWSRITIGTIQEMEKFINALK
ncbi:pyridoxal phosphate-dependent aminotransferase [Tenacibaculum sp.]|uniref:pyridoxal phosphate-dependent aminotransferase n=1 Tax=Tenacibaculum sp. TaxID=1906242 RepID=UPI003AA89359